MYPMTRVVRPCPTLLTLLLLCACTGGCGISRQQEIQIGREARPQFEQEFGGLYPDERVQQYVNEIGKSMVRYTGRPDLPWEFRVLNSDQLNAFALPGGFVYVTRGLLSRMENEAQLAAVLGHEAGHVAHRHSVDQLQRAQLVQGGFLLAGLLGGERVANYSDVGQLVAGLALMKYGRDQEKEADLSGLKYIAREGYDPRAMVEVMEKFEQAAQGTGRPPEFLSSHPSPQNRQEYLREEIVEDYGRLLAGGRRDRDEFQQIMRPILAGGP